MDINPPGLVLVSKEFSLLFLLLGMHPLTYC